MHKYVQDMYKDLRSLVGLSSKSSGVQSETKILLWTQFFGMEWFTIVLDGCPDIEKICRFIYSPKNFSLLNEVDAVLVHAYDVNCVKDLPPKTIFSPYLIMYSEETAQISPSMSNPQIMARFDAGLTYSIDADIPGPQMRGLMETIPNLMSFEKKLDAVFVAYSGCVAMREKFIKEFGRISKIPLHSYGECANNTAEFLQSNDSKLNMSLVDQFTVRSPSMTDPFWYRDVA